jgi:hypothetical protein
MVKNDDQNEVVMLLVAGLFGSLLSVGKNSGATTRENVVAIGSGLGSAYFITPLILEFLGKEVSIQAQSGIAFLLGVLGLRGVEMIVNKLGGKVE